MNDETQTAQTLRPGPVQLSTYDETAAFLRVSRQTVRRWVKMGMPSHQPTGPKGNRWFDLYEVGEWIRNKCSTPGDEAA